MKLTLKLK